MYTTVNSVDITDAVSPALDSDRARVAIAQEVRAQLGALDPTPTQYSVKLFEQICAGLSSPLPTDTDRLFVANCIADILAGETRRLDALADAVRIGDAYLVQEGTTARLAELVNAANSAFCALAEQEEVLPYFSAIKPLLSFHPDW